MSSQFQADNTFVRQSQSATEPLESADHGIVDGVLSGLIRQNDLAQERFVPKLISNQPGSTMGDAIREELRESETFDISVAFVSENALKSMYQSFLDHAENSEKTNRIITSTKNYFNTPKAFKELLKLIAATTTCMLVVRISRHSLCRINVNGIFVSRRRAKRNSLNRSGRSWQTRSVSPCR